MTSGPPIPQDVLRRLRSALWPPALERPTKPLFHYTNGSGFDGILKDRAIWASDYRFLNDSTEIEYGEDLVLGVLRELVPTSQGSARVLFDDFVQFYDKYRITNQGHIFIASLSEEPDALSQWRAYTPFGDGYSVGLDLSTFVLRDKAAGDKVGGGLLKCDYSPEDTKSRARQEMLRIVELFERACDELAGTAERWTQLLLTYLRVAAEYAAYIALPSKNRAFEAEKEWRLVALANATDEDVKLEFRHSSQGLVPYVRVPLSLDARLPLVKVVVRSLSVARLRLQRDGYDQELVETSLAPFRQVR
jgi:DUF2971 family protein